jgi:hypothetical protein
MHEVLKYAGIAALAVALYNLVTVTMHLNLPAAGGAVTSR